jgi:TPR repeat protein
MKRHSLFAALFLAALFPAGASADLAFGVELFERGEFARSYDELLPDAERGDAVAQYVVGVILLNNLAPNPPENKDAAYWITRSAEQGYVRAQSELARMYRTGDGVKEDLAKAVAWYRKAAEAGDVGAQLFVADAYAYGHGVEADRIEAYMWYEIALEYWGSLAVRARDLVAEKMTADEVAEAERRAGEWRRARQQPKAAE